MDADHTSTVRATLLDRLKPEDASLIRDRLISESFKVRQKLEIPNTKITHAYFFETGIASVLARTDRGHSQVEVAKIGREGMTGTTALHGISISRNLTVVQVAGHGYSISIASLRSAMAASSTLATRLLQYAHVVALQASQAALAHAHGTMAERVARWLLMSQDRIGADDRRITHAHLADLLGARRPSVTVTLNNLEERGFILTRRGAIAILDRTGLRKLAGGFYGIPEAEYSKLFEQPFSLVNTKATPRLNLPKEKH